MTLSRLGQAVTVLFGAPYILVALLAPRVVRCSYREGVQEELFIFLLNLEQFHALGLGWVILIVVPDELCRVIHGLVVSVGPILGRRRRRSARGFARCRRSTVLESSSTDCCFRGRLSFPLWGPSWNTLCSLLLELGDPHAHALHVAAEAPLT